MSEPRNTDILSEYEELKAAIHSCLVRAGESLRRADELADLARRRLGAAQLGETPVETATTNGLPRRYTVEEACAYFDTTAQTLRLWMRQGLIDCYRHARQPVFSLEQLLEGERRLKER